MALSTRAFWAGRVGQAMEALRRGRLLPPAVRAECVHGGRAPVLLPPPRSTTPLPDPAAVRARRRGTSSCCEELAPLGWARKRLRRIYNVLANFHIPSSPPAPLPPLLSSRTLF